MRTRFALMLSSGTMSVLLAVPSCSISPTCVTDDDCDDGDRCTADACHANECVKVAIENCDPTDGATEPAADEPATPEPQAEPPAPECVANNECDDGDDRCTNDTCFAGNCHNTFREGCIPGFSFIGIWDVSSIQSDGRELYEGTLDFSASGFVQISPRSGDYIPPLRYQITGVMRQHVEFREYVFDAASAGRMTGTKGGLVAHAGKR